MTTTKPRCEGGNCPSKTNCRLFTERMQMVDSPYAALYVRREAGSSACDLFSPVRVVSTFEVAE